MKRFSKFAMALAAPLLLTGCLWAPGKFNSTLAMDKGGSFVLDYKGELVLTVPDDADRKPTPWEEKMARCTKSGEPELLESWQMTDGLDDEVSDDDVRPCTAAEKAELKKKFEAAEQVKVAEARKSAEEASKMFGIPGVDDASGRAYAAKLMKYNGWRSVTYRGNGVFDVDFHLQGQLAQDFVFPTLPDANFIVPFIALRRRSDGAILMTAPALSGPSDPGAAAGAGMAQAMSKGSSSKAEGRLTVTTNGEVLTNNSEDGPQPQAGGRRQVHWDIAPGAPAKVPEMLVRL